MLLHPIQRFSPVFLYPAHPLSFFIENDTQELVSNLTVSNQVVACLNNVAKSQF